MRHLIYCVLLFVFIQSIFAQCSNFNNNCTGCTEQPNCGYCYSTGICQTGSYTGPAQGLCLIGWYFGADACPNCPKQSSCSGCTQTPSCVWCTNSQTCESSANVTGNCLISHTCDCRSHLHCQRCLGDSKCSWCPDRNTCEDTSSTTCSKPVKSCPNCNATSDCQTCNGQWGCNWCVQNKTGSCQESSMCQGGQVGQCTSVCKTLTDCSFCTRASGCGWCEKTAQCYGGDTTDTTCLLTHTCKNSGSSFRASSFVGGMFFVIGLALVGFGIIMGYRHYSNRGGSNEYEKVN